MSTAKFVVLAGVMTGIGAHDQPHLDQGSL
jgi:hypothetical protein